MTQASWARLDNASNIFLAARSDADPKVFRISADMDADVDAELLQAALNRTFDRYKLYHSVLRGGVFWYYLQESTLRPTVTREQLHTCAPLYKADRRNLLFRVIYHRRRISLEIFHALSDGTGALWFLTDLVQAYLGADRCAAADDFASTSADNLDPHAVGAERPDTHQLTTDSFVHYFHRGSEPLASFNAGAEDATVAQAAVARGALATAATAATDVATRTVSTVTRWVRARPKRVYRVRGTRTPDNRPRLVELTMPADQVLARARAEHVSITMYLTALFFLAVRTSAGTLGRSRTLSASVPINLRQFFPSTSARNFFATVRVEHTFGEGADELGDLCRSLEAQFRPRATPQALDQKLRRFIRFEQSPMLRIFPRVLKDVVLRAINRGNNRGLSVAVSNLGRVVLPEPAESRVGRMLFHVSAVRPQFCAISHDGLLTVSFTSPFIETDHVRDFVRQLTDSGVDVSVAAARATEAELAEVDS